ncbi:large subunit ribosomal protein L14e [Nematocida homosporus]|uniref:large subunit ribosomal protein L14e n=1 Tax=Nematocida homosporus TaxID=1912981 RepID=UPI00222018B5|nr:large subunit ribosomal protein L14e [Nematocida homosporus]KAI5186153.1 large subunit ribosomal protein L14e [Nematocida homosporus]
MERRNLLEKGRVAEFKCKKMSAVLAVVIEFITLESVVAQLVCVKTGKCTERKVIVPKHLVLTDKVIEFDDSEEIRGEKFVASIESNITEALEAKKESKAYQNYLAEERMKEMNDFERFLVEQKEIAKNELLKSKGF